MAPTPAQLATAHRATVAVIRARVEAFTQTAWAGTLDYRDADIDRMVRRMLPVIESGQKQIANVTNAYISTLTGQPRAAINPRATAARGVPPAEVYRRPAATVYTKLSQGASYSDAVAAGGARLQSLAGTDMLLAMREQSRTSMQASGIVGYRRVLSGGDSCALCSIASTQRYRVEDLMPIHPGCSCGVEPIIGDRDPGRIINADKLDQVYDDVDGLKLPTGSAKDLRKITIREHGEYGPTLSWRSDAFTGPSRRYKTGFR